MEKPSSQLEGYYKIIKKSRGLFKTTINP